MSVQVPSVARTNPIADFARGFFVPFRALAVLFSTPQLILLGLLVGFLTLACITGVGFLIWSLSPNLVDLVWRPSDALWASTLQGVLKALLFLVLFGSGCFALPPIVTAPAMDPISVATERAMGFPVGEAGIGRVAQETLRAVLNAALRAAVLIAGHGLLFLLLLLPAVGAPAWTLLSWLWSTLWVASQYLDVPMARHLYGFRIEARILRSRLALCLGFGTAISLMLWIPFLTCFFAPLGVIGATLLFRGLVATGELAPPPEPGAPQAR